MGRLGGKAYPVGILVGSMTLSFQAHGAVEFLTFFEKWGNHRDGRR